MRTWLLPVGALFYIWPLLQLLGGSLDQGGLGNYGAVWQRVDFAGLLLRSLWISATTVVLGALVNGMAGYALARLRFPGRAAALALVLVCMVIPFEAVAVPLFYCVSKLGLRDTLSVQILPFVANGFSIYLFYTFYLDFPQELEEAACLEGANRWQIFVRLVLPNSGSVLATHSVISLLFSWSAYLWPLLVTAGPRARPLALAMATFLGTPPLHWGQIFAFGVMMVAPLVLCFVWLQSFLRPGGWTGGIK